MFPDHRFLKLFTYSCLHWVFAVAHGFLWLRRGGPLSNGGVRASHCRVQALGAWASGLVAHGTWDLSRPRLEPVSLSLVGRFLTTGLSKKSSHPFKKEQLKIQNTDSQRENSMKAENKVVNLHSKEAKLSQPSYTRR